MSKTMYLECVSGISGDMVVAALLDLGAEEAVLLKALKSLSISGFEVDITRVKKAGLDVCDFNVILEHENHDHDMEYLHKHHAHEHQEHHAHEHHHRRLADVLAIIGRAEITPRAKTIASDIFTILGHAEAKAHGTTIEEVHFHEVGAVDSIVDIVAAAVCLDNLSITDVIVPKLYEGTGTIRCQHGVIPVPVPAVVHIAEAHGLKLHITQVEGELITPTGAAIVAAIITSHQLPEHFAIQKSGMGGGKRNYERPSILKAMLIEALHDARHTARVYKLESNIDDCSGEVLGFAMERLLEEGAKDVYYTPIFMKKNRPAYQLNIICQEQDLKKMEQIVFEETTTIGIRKVQMDRTVLQREIRTVTTSLGEASVKVCHMDGQVKMYPEYESVVALCREHQHSYQEVYGLIQRTALEEKQ